MSHAGFRHIHTITRRNPLFVREISISPISPPLSLYGIFRFHPLSFFHPETRKESILYWTLKQILHTGSTFRSLSYICCTIRHEDQVLIRNRVILRKERIQTTEKLPVFLRITLCHLRHCRMKLIRQRIDLIPVQCGHLFFRDVLHFIRQVFIKHQFVQQISYGSETEPFRLPCLRTIPQ